MNHKHALVCLLATTSLACSGSVAGVTPEDSGAGERFAAPDLVGVVAMSPADSSAEIDIRTELTATFSRTPPHSMPPNDARSLPSVYTAPRDPLTIQPIPGFSITD